VESQPGAWWRGMNRKKTAKAEQPTNQAMAFDIFMLSLSLSLSFSLFPYAQHMDFTNAQHHRHGPHQQF
jgi:hypothetical protein